VGLALAVCLMGTAVGFDRDRAFYSAVTLVVASYYGLFAVMGGSMPALMKESVAMTAFLVLAILGFKRSPWILVAALFAHGVYDAVHGRLLSNPGLPLWWPSFCLAYDVTSAAYLGALLRHRHEGQPARHL
jgi:hypothetical protein